MRHTWYLGMALIAIGCESLLGLDAPYRLAGDGGAEAAVGGAGGIGGVPQTAGTGATETTGPGAGGGRW